MVLFATIALQVEIKRHHLLRLVHLKGGITMTLQYKQTDMDLLGHARQLIDVFYVSSLLNQL